MQKYEYYDDPEGDITYINAHWGAMTFTATSDHPMNRVRLRLHIASGGTCYVKIKATDGSGHPTGAALLSKTINGPFGHAVDMNDIDFASSIDLTNGTKYAIEVNGYGQITYVTRRWTGASYSGGNMENSTNSGSSWSSLGQDWCFEIWGNDIIAGGGGAGPAGLLIAHGHI